MTLPDTNAIPLLSSEALWEWHLHSDALFLSQGALHDLQLSKGNTPKTMSDFLAHIPPPCLPTLHEMREAVLTGATGSFAEITYPFEKVLVRERMVVLSRDAQGRALQTMGHYHVSPLQSSYLPPITSNKGVFSGFETGYWRCSLTEKTVQIDALCSTLLGHANATAMAFTLEEWESKLHPEENVTNSSRYQLIFDEPLMGDIIEDMLCIPLQDGSYTNLMMRGAVVQRDACGKAQHLVGTLQSNELTKIHSKLPPQENGRLLFAINATGDGIWDWDAQTDKVYFSSRYLSMLGYTAEEFGCDLALWAERIHPDDYEKIVYPQRQVVESPQYGDTFECVYRLKRADGNWAWILGRGYVTHRDNTGKATRLVGLHTDVTLMQTGRQQLEDLVKNDPLTGLRSRNYCDMDMERIERHQIRPISIISCDITGLKLINDYMGHAVGDILLQKAAFMLRHSLRATDCIARTGGDEFVILLPSCTAEKARIILRNIEKHFAQYNESLTEMPIYISLGMASADSTEVPLSKVAMNADRHMLRNKLYTRRDCHQRIKAWIESNMNKDVSLEDARYEGVLKDGAE